MKISSSYFKSSKPISIFIRYPQRFKIIYQTCDKTTCHKYKLKRERKSLIFDFQITKKKKLERINYLRKRFYLSTPSREVTITPRFIIIFPQWYCAQTLVCVILHRRWYKTRNKERILVATLGITPWVNYTRKKRCASVYHPCRYLSSRCVIWPGDKHPCQATFCRDRASFPPPPPPPFSARRRGCLPLPLERRPRGGRWWRTSAVTGEGGKSEGSHRASYPEQRRWDGMPLYIYSRCCSSRWPICVGLSSKREVRANLFTENFLLLLLLEIYISSLFLSRISNPGD